MNILDRETIKEFIHFIGNGFCYENRNEYIYLDINIIYELFIDSYTKEQLIDKVERLALDKTITVFEDEKSPDSDTLLVSKNSILYIIAELQSDELYNIDTILDEIINDFL